jgi:hypothetical protein
LDFQRNTNAASGDCCVRRGQTPPPRSQTPPPPQNKTPPPPSVSYVDTLPPCTCRKNEDLGCCASRDRWRDLGSAPPVFFSDKNAPRGEAEIEERARAEAEQLDLLPPQMVSVLRDQEIRVQVNIKMKGSEKVTTQTGIIPAPPVSITLPRPCGSPPIPPDPPPCCPPAPPKELCPRCTLLAQRKPSCTPPPGCCRPASVSSRGTSGTRASSATRESACSCGSGKGEGEPPPVFTLLLSLLQCYGMCLALLILCLCYSRT